MGYLSTFVASTGAAVKQFASVGCAYRARRRRSATRYVTPLREGGSLPGLMEADDLGTYVVKFVGAGQGRKALVAEVDRRRAGARRSGCRCRRWSRSSSTRCLRRTSRTRRSRTCCAPARAAISASTSCPARSTSTPAAFELDPGFAGRVLWFDALVGNVDRSWRNPNMLFWHGRPYLIDHGATLTFHHNWPRRARPRPAHTTPANTPCSAAGPISTPPTPRWPLVAATVAAALALVPDEWLDRRARLRRSAGRPTRRFAARLAARDAWGRRCTAVAAGPVRAARPARGRVVADDPVPVRVRGRAGRAAGRARRVDQRRRARVLPRARLPRCRGPPRRGPAAGARPRRRRRRTSAPHSTRSPTPAASDGADARRRARTSAAASAG